MPTILGIDPGLNTTGYGVVATAAERTAVTGAVKVRLLEAGIVRSRGDNAVQKVKEIYDGVKEVIENFRPDVLAMEQLYTHYDRPTTAILMGHARGCICLAAAQAGIVVVSYEATKIKKILTGSGRASKEQVQRAVKLELNLDTYPEPPDVADALAVALCHLYHGRIS
jgi:crossover junction endodeoxyribonuclease RuvC